MLVTKSIYAQHCAFDGTYLLVVHLVDKKGNPIQLSTSNLILQEVDNSNPAVCNFANQVIRKPFMPVKDALVSHSKQSYDLWIEDNYKSWELLKPGYYAVLLKQEECSCMVIQPSNNYNSDPRHFTIVYQQRKKLKSITVQLSSFYSLCTANGDWERIVPILIKKSN